MDESQTKKRLKRPSRSAQLSPYAFQQRFNAYTLTGLDYATLMDIAFWLLANEIGVNAPVPPLENITLNNDRITPELRQLLGVLGIDV